MSVVLLPLLLATACSSSGGSQADDTPSQASGSPLASSAPSLNGQSVEKRMRLPDHATYLVKVRNGEGTEDVPDFTPGKNVYTVHVKCSGARTVTVVERANPKDDPTTIKCSSPVTIGRVYGDPVKQQLAIQAADDARWTLAVVDGKRPF
ncbi:hypothetical protein [Streptomyces sp. NPDC051214]|uniref:hypothetical protein n=1 Tax=Streptomyces sp. NPDC051214 TaxID=3155282 RepID=UPI003432333E